jgi:hypothetical protein
MIFLGSEGKVGGQSKKVWRIELCISEFDTFDSRTSLKIPIRNFEGRIKGFKE